MKRVAVITGGSSGIGKATAGVFAAHGYAVYELSRSGTNTGSVTHITADIADQTAVTAAFQSIYEEQGRVDVVVNNAGMGISGAAEFTDIAAAKRLFDINYFGTAISMQAAMPYLRETKGRIINISSVAGVLPVPFQSDYSASKAAVNALSEAVRNEVRMFGISICCALPGDARTGFTAVRKKQHVGDDIYQGKIERSVSGMERDEQTGMTPDYVAQQIYRIAQKRRVRPFYTIGHLYKLLYFASRVLPRRTVNFVIGKLYAK